MTDEMPPKFAGRVLPSAKWLRAARESGIDAEDMEQALRIQPLQIGDVRRLRLRIGPSSSTTSLGPKSCTAADSDLIGAGSIVANTGGVATLFHAASAGTLHPRATGDAASHLAKRRRVTGVSSIGSLSLSAFPNWRRKAAQCVRVRAGDRIQASLAERERAILRSKPAFCFPSVRLTRIERPVRVVRVIGGQPPEDCAGERQVRLPAEGATAPESLRSPDRAEL